MFDTDFGHRLAHVLCGPQGRRVGLIVNMRQRQLRIRFEAYQKPQRHSPESDASRTLRSWPQRSERAFEPPSARFGAPAFGLQAGAS
jgi:hypothetical protein